MDPLPAVNDALPVASLDDCQGGVFRLYIAEKKTLKEVMQTIENTYGIVATQAIYKAKFGKWGYHKNTKRQDAMTILRMKKQRESAGKDTIFFLKGRPVDMDKIEGFARRQKIRDVDQKSLFQSSQDLYRDLVPKTPPHSPLERPPSLPRAWQIPAKLLYHVDIYIRGSFEAGAWSFNGNENIILSSQLQSLERQSLHSFVGGIDTGCGKFSSGDSITGGLYWRNAFREIETLVRGSYHDILPNIMQKINDLHQRGYRDAALMLMKHVAARSLVDQLPGRMTGSIFGSLAEVDLDHMQELEELVMTRYIELFELYLGSRCYNSFVMRMNLARRKIIQGGVSELDHRLPDLSPLDHTFGVSNRLSMDVIRTRVEVFYENEKYGEMEVQASILLERAILIEGDEWQNLYFVIKGFYYTGLAQYFLRNYIVGIESLKFCLEWIGEFEKIDGCGLFNPEKAEVLEKLEEMSILIGDQQSASGWRSQRIQVLESLRVKDSI